MRVPALLQSKVTYFDLSDLKGKWSMICCLPPFDFGEAVFLNQYHRAVQKERTMLLGMLPFSDPVLDPCLPKAKALRIPLLADPLQRLQRLFGLVGKPFTNSCQSFVVDPTRVIRYHLIHQLNWRGLAFLMEILKHCQDQYLPSPRPPICLPKGNNPLMTPQTQTMGNTSAPIRPFEENQKGETSYVTKSTS